MHSSKGLHSGKILQMEIYVVDNYIFCHMYHFMLILEVNTTFFCIKGNIVLLQDCTFTSHRGDTEIPIANLTVDGVLS